MVRLNPRTPCVVESGSLQAIGDRQSLSRPLPQHVLSRRLRYVYSVVVVVVVVVMLWLVVVVMLWLVVYCCEWV